MKLSTYIKTTTFSLLLSSAMFISAAEVSKEIELSLNSSEDLIFIQNLAGQIQVSPSSDNQIHIRGLVVANANNKNKANELLDTIQFDTEKTRNQTVISIEYPISDYTGFIYNPNNKKPTWGNSSSTSRYMGEKVKVASKPKGLLTNWAEVYTDLSIELPADQYSKIKLIKGGIQAQDLNNDVALDTSSGKISITDSQGKLNADSGSGSITINDFTGLIKADTGSGGINISDAKGDVDADTGSGSIKINQVAGAVKADTGSGSVVIEDYLGGELLEIDTGSGSVRVYGDLGKLNKLDIDTGSGSVKLVSTHAPSLDIDIGTGSGRVNVDLPNLNVRKDKNRKFLATAGDGKGKASIGTGSGSVSFRMDSDYDASYEKPAKVIQEKTLSKSNNTELVNNVLAALNQDSDLRKADLTITAKGSEVFVKGTVENVLDLPKAIKIINDVDGVEDISIDVNTAN